MERPEPPTGATFLGSLNHWTETRGPQQTFAHEIDRRLTHAVSGQQRECILSKLSNGEKSRAAYDSCFPCGYSNGGAEGPYTTDSTYPFWRGRAVAGNGPQYSSYCSDCHSDAPMPRQGGNRSSFTVTVMMAV
ncbi:hypothetical protein AVEN_70197-1 [Araneus ventricosus]|uniref:Uncharacterized protein n=1 Tax=Araneus ventricosus TaxID=182803 RepID=A0A4Y2FFG8_ARAVE|nr:hypothetical protein AVEN_70197-1 [Araneus ventricosus]